MATINQRARDLLAAQYPGYPDEQRRIRHGQLTHFEIIHTIPAIVAALGDNGSSAEQEATYVLIQRTDALRLCNADVNSPGHELSRRRVYAQLFPEKELKS